MTDIVFETYTKYGFQNSRSMLMKKGKEGYFPTDPIHTYNNQQDLPFEVFRPYTKRRSFSVIISLVPFHLINWYLEQ